MTDSRSESNLKIGGILLAAGGSSRLGKPKQLLKFQSRSLIRIDADTLTNSLCRPIVVVLGAETDRSAFEVADLPVGVCANGEWQTGMGSSIRSGLQHLLGNEPDLDAVVIALCDQPLVTAADIDSLITEFITTTSPIVAARYGGIVGVPALFSKLFLENFSVWTATKAPDGSSAAAPTTSAPSQSKQRPSTSIRPMTLTA